MTPILNEADFTEQLVTKLRDWELDVSVPEALSIQINYGEGEPRLTIKLAGAYDQYREAPEKLEILLQPFLTEIGWTRNSPHYAARDIYENVMPVMIDLLRAPGADSPEQETATALRGPLVRQELIDRVEEHLVVQFALRREQELLPLHMGDILPCFPDERQLASIAMQNLKLIVLQNGLTMSEFPVENFQIRPWLIGLRGGKFSQFLASLITVPEVMETLEKALNAPEGILAIAPACDQLLLSSNLDEAAVCEMGLLAGFLKKEAQQPVSGFVWRFKGGFLEQVQSVDLEERT